MQRLQLRGGLSLFAASSSKPLGAGRKAWKWLLGSQQCLPHGSQPRPQPLCPVPCGHSAEMLLEPWLFMEGQLSSEAPIAACHMGLCKMFTVLPSAPPSWSLKCPPLSHNGEDPGVSLRGREIKFSLSERSYNLRWGWFITRREVSGKYDQYLIWIHFYLYLFSPDLDFHWNYFSRCSDPIYTKLTWTLSKVLCVQQSLRLHLSFPCKPLHHSPPHSHAQPQYSLKKSLI